MFKFQRRELVVAAGRGLRANDMLLLYFCRRLALRVFVELVRSA